MRCLLTCTSGPSSSLLFPRPPSPGPDTPSLPSIPAKPRATDLLEPENKPRQPGSTVVGADNFWDLTK